MPPLDAHSLAHLHAALQILADLDPDGAATTAEARSRLAAMIEQRQAATLGQLGQVKAATQPPPSRPLCPSCGRGALLPVANRDGLRILGCRLCRYSRIEEAR